MMHNGLPFHCVWLLACQSLKNKVKPFGGHAQKVNVLVEVPIASDTYKFVMNRSLKNKLTAIIVEITGVLQKVSLIHFCLNFF